MIRMHPIPGFFAFLLCAAANLVFCHALPAQTRSWYPFRVSTESGSVQFGVSGRLILEGYFPGQQGSGLIVERAGFFSGRGSLFGDLYLGKHLYVTGEFRLDTGEAPQKGVLSGRLEQAFLRYKPWADRNLHIQYGKFVSPFGAYNQRHDMPADPFIRPPVMYDYRTMVSSNFIPRSNDGFISWKYDPQTWRPRGAPPVWGNPYQVGAMAFGGFRKFDFRLALMNSAPSSEPAMWNYQIGREIHPSYVAHAGYRILPEFYFAIAYNSGPYLGESAKASVPEAEFNSYKQKTWEAEFLFERGKTQIRGEFFHDSWYVENVMDKPVDLSGYAEIKQKILPGLYGAFRFGSIHYNEIRLSNGAREPWDFTAWRAQIAVGYLLFRNLELRTEYMSNHTAGLPDPRDNLFSLQCRIGF
jgi:hypothetical protein